MIVERNTNIKRKVARTEGEGETYVGANCIFKGKMQKKGKD